MPDLSLTWFPHALVGVASAHVRPTLTIVSSWTFDPFLGSAIVLCALAYLWCVRTVARRHPDRPWSRRCTASFLSALAIAWIVVLGPIGAFDDTFFWAHMVQHVALMMLVAPLLLLGAPVLLILRVSSPATRHKWVMPVLRSRLVTWLCNPVVGWVIFAGVLVGTHFSPFYEYALEHPVVHDYVEHPLYLGAALIFYYPLLPGNPGPRTINRGLRALSLFSMMFPETMTGFFIYATRQVMYPFYEHVQRPFGPSAITDQQLGGALMWGGSMIIDSVWVAVAVLDWLRSETRLAARIDLQTMAGLRPLASPPPPS